MINIIVGLISAIAAGFLFFWALRPSFRKWVEQPKYRMLKEERRFSEDRRD